MSTRSAEMAALGVQPWQHPLYLGGYVLRILARTYISLVRYHEKTYPVVSGDQLVEMYQEENVDLPGVIPYTKLAADSSASWSFVAQTIQRADSTKVKDTKEDIDTLLVFAGLFSAVMTGFIVESYKYLIPDQGASTADALRTISTQMTSYVFSSQFANSTRAAASTSPFHPSPTAIRVNALWFASLICSLMAASLGMLVKQWLREYLAVDYLSPQARIRIRQFRWQGLKTWKVFEIAAMLPLLLQVALGLFFLGLCLFTLSVNHIVGWTSTPLVLAWATFFMFTVIAPAISSHCPFKTTFLKFALTSIRRVLRHHVSPLSEKQASFPDDSGNSPRPVVVADDGSTASTLQVSKSDAESKPKEEEDALTSKSQDFNILLDFDAINSDDELLGTVIRTILTPTRRNGEAVLSFVQKIIEHRLQRDVSLMSPARYAPYLATRARLALVDILSDALCYEVQQRLFPTVPHAVRRDSEEDTLSGWMFTTLQMIVALAGDNMKNSEAAAMAYCLMFDPYRFKDVMGDSKLTNGDLLTLLGVAQDRLRGSPGSDIMNFLRNTSQWYTNSMVQGRGLVPSTTLGAILRSSEPKLPEDCLSAILGLLVDTLRAQRNSGWEDWMTEAMDCLIDASDPTDSYYCLGALDKTCDLIVIMLTDHSYLAGEVLRSMTRKPPFDWHSRYWMLGLLLGRKLSKLQGGIPAMLRNIKHVVTNIHDELNRIRICTVICNMASYFFAPEDIQTHRSQWRALFDALSRTITPSVDLTLPDRMAIAHCLERIDLFDNVEATAPGVRKEGEKVVPIVSDELIDVLSGIAEDTSRRVEYLNRVRTLRTLRESERTGQTNTSAFSETQSLPEENFEDALEVPLADLPSLALPALRSPQSPPTWPSHAYTDQPLMSRTLNSPTVASSTILHENNSGHDSSLQYPSIEDWLLSLDNDAIRSRQHRLKYTSYADALDRNGIYDLGDLVLLRTTEPQQAVQKLQELGGMVYGIASRLLDFARVDVNQIQREQEALRDRGPGLATRAQTVSSPQFGERLHPGFDSTRNSSF